MRWGMAMRRLWSEAASGREEGELDPLPLDSACSGTRTAKYAVQGPTRFNGPTLPSSLPAAHFIALRSASPLRHKS